MWKFFFLCCWYVDKQGAACLCYFDCPSGEKALFCVICFIISSICVVCMKVTTQKPTVGSVALIFLLKLFVSMSSFPVYSWCTNQGDMTVWWKFHSKSSHFWVSCNTLQGIILLVGCSLHVKCETFHAVVHTHDEEVACLQYEIVI